MTQEEAIKALVKIILATALFCFCSFTLRAQEKVEPIYCWDPNKGIVVLYNITIGASSEYAFRAIADGDSIAFFMKLDKKHWYPCNPNDYIWWQCHTRRCDSMLKAIETKFGIKK